MTLWFDRNTLDMYVDTNDDGIRYREYEEGDRAYIKMIVPAGVAFDFNSYELRREFEGCNINIDLPDKNGTLKEFEDKNRDDNKKLGLRFDEDVEIIVSSDKGCTSSLFGD